MAYTIKSNNGGGDWKGNCRSVTVHDESNGIVAWYSWRRSYRSVEVDVTFVDETTRKKDVHYRPPVGFPGDLWTWFLSECQTRYGIAIFSDRERVGSQANPEPVPAL